MFGNRQVANSINGLRSFITEQNNAIRQNTAAYNRIADELENANALKEDELETKDRVDISLKEYMNLINERDMLLDKVNTYESIFEGFNLPSGVEIIPGSVSFEHNDDILNLIRRYRLMFDVDLVELRRLGLDK